MSFVARLNRDSQSGQVDTSYHNILLPDFPRNNAAARVVRDLIHESILHGLRRGYTSGVMIQVPYRAANLFIISMPIASVPEEVRDILGYALRVLKPRCLHVSTRIEGNLKESRCGREGYVSKWGIIRVGFGMPAAAKRYKWRESGTSAPTLSPGQSTGRLSSTWISKY